MNFKLYFKRVFENPELIRAGVELNVFRGYTSKGELDFETVDDVGECIFRDSPFIMNFPFNLSTDRNNQYFEALTPFFESNENKKAHIKHATTHLEINNKFKIRVYWPDVTKISNTNFSSHTDKAGLENFSFNEVFIMINGFAESDISVYDHIGLSLAQKGIPSILVPLPFHFNRHFQFKEYKDQNDCFYLKDSEKFNVEELKKLIAQFIFQALYKIPTLFYHHIKQHENDINNLIENHLWNKDSVLGKLFNNNTKINLLGYSLGGLQALHLARKQFDEGVLFNKRYDKIILLESGASLDIIKVDLLLARSHALSRLLFKYYYQERKKLHKFQSFFYNKFINEKSNIEKF